MVKTYYMVVCAGLDGVTMLRRNEASLGEVITGLGLQRNAWVSQVKEAGVGAWEGGGPGARRRVDVAPSASSAPPGVANKTVETEHRPQIGKQERWVLQGGR